MRLSPTFARFALSSMALLASVPSGAQTVVKYGVAAISMSHAPAMMAVAAPEIFAKHGIRMDLTDFRGNSQNCLTAMITGAVETCQTGTTTGTDAIAEGANIKGVAVIIGPISEIVLSAKAVAKLGGVNAASPLAERMRALKGLRLVSSGPGTAHYVTLDAMMKKAGMSISDIKFRTLGDTIAMMEGIRNDQIDGAMWTVGTLAGVLADKSGVRWINVAGGEVPEFRGVPYVTTYAQTAWVEKNPDTVARMHAALSDATAAMKKDPAKYSKLLKDKYFPQLDQGLWDESYKQGVPSLLDGARAPKAGWEYFLQLQAENTKKDYSKAAWERALIPAAQSK